MTKMIFILIFSCHLFFLSSPSFSQIPKITPGSPLPANIFVELAKSTNPAVVNISTSRLPKNHRYRNSPRFHDPLADMLEGIWGINPRTSRPSHSLGTGFIIRQDGLIITNNHVIANADVIRVQLLNSKKTFYEAKVIGRDKRTDIALIKINANKKLPIIPLGSSSSLQVGQWVAAFGNPYGHGHSMSKGIISAKGRYLDEINRFPFLQTDASINPGNSGGPLVNLKGEVIGVNTAIDARAQGIGFAIPIDNVKTIIKELETNGKVQRGYLGIQMKNLTPRAAQILRLNSTKGVVITQVVPESPAAKAKLKVYDVIMGFNKKVVAHTGDISRYISDITVGKTISLKIFRNGKKIRVAVRIDALPNSFSSTNIKRDKDYYGKKAPYQLGFKVAHLTKKMAQNWNINSKLVGTSVVISILHNSAAAESGLQVGDIIVEVNRKTVKTPQQVVRSLTKGANLLRVARGNSWQIVFLQAK